MKVSDIPKHEVIIFATAPKLLVMQKARRIIREKKTVGQMMLIYCHKHHHTRGKELCSECSALLSYAHARIDKCTFLPDKPTCKNCVVHCYAPKKKDAIKEVMRYAGPRMLLRSPLLAIGHLLDGRKDEERVSRFQKNKQNRA